MYRNGFSKKTICTAVLCLGVVVGAYAQLDRSEEGFEWGSFFIRPEVSAGVAYDNRVLTAPQVEGDVYSEASAGVRINNGPAKYGVAALANYGTRAYSEYSDLDDDFYRGSLSVGTREGIFNWDLSTDYRKSLNYDPRYNPYNGSGPDSILSDQPSIRSQTKGSVSYAIPTSERVSIVPEYGLWHYYQEFIDAYTAEWQVHRVSVPVKYAYTEKTLLSVGGGMAYQTNKEEDGYISSVYFGAESRATEKTSYSAYVGVSVADYEISGSQMSGVSDAKMVWRATEKLSAYVFGGNRFEPGYNGGVARMVYRAGYGGDWKMTKQWSLGAQGLHDYEEAVGSGAGANNYGDVSHFYTVRLGYTLPRWAEISLSGKYVMDEIDQNQTVIALRVDCRL